MALIGCPECNHRISEFAESCPNCGYILEPDDAAQIKEWEAQARKRQEGKFDPASCLIGTTVIVFLILVLISAVSAIFDKC